MKVLQSIMKKENIKLSPIYLTYFLNVKVMHELLHLQGGLKVIPYL